VSLEVDGQHIGVALVPRSGTLHESYALPARADAAAPRELRLLPYRWVTLPIHGLTQLVSFRPVRIAITP